VTLQHENWIIELFCHTTTNLNYRIWHDIMKL